MSPSSDDFWLEADGVTVRHAGATWKIRVRRIGRSLSIDLEPTAAAKRTEAYRKARRELGDDFVISVFPHGSEDLYVKAAKAAEAALGRRMNPARAEAVAQTILDQIGRRTRMELGVRELVYGNFDDEGVSRPGLMGRASGSKIQRGGKFIVMLDEGRDTYVVRVMTVMNHGLKVTEKAYLTDVYAESLPRVLTSVFG